MEGHPNRYPAPGDSLDCGQRSDCLYARGGQLWGSGNFGGQLLRALDSYSFPGYRFFQPECGRGHCHGQCCHGGGSNLAFPVCYIQAVLCDDYRDDKSGPGIVEQALEVDWNAILCRRYLLFAAAPYHRDCNIVYRGMGGNQISHEVLSGKLPKNL